MAHVSEALKPKARDQELRNGLEPEYCEKMSTLLSDTLVSTYQLLIKSHLYHWNVVGPLFKPLHDLTEEHYQALLEAADIIAERIRALGHLAPVQLSEAAGFFSRAA
ncbi:ferritin-like domain-containing protein [Roseibium salinum]|nr:ferritin-like domain-containing protein [Roseibium salinum]